MADIVDRLRFDAVRCELQFSKGVATNIEGGTVGGGRQTAELRDGRVERMAKAIFWCMNSVMHDHEKLWKACDKQVVYRDCAEAALSALGL